MKAHKVETVVAENGTLILHDLPFPAGEAVEVIVLQEQRPKLPLSNPYTLRGTVIRYDEPTEPVAVQDWEVLQ